MARLEAELNAIRQKNQRVEQNLAEELASLGLNTTELDEAIDTYQPSEEFQERADKALQAIAANVIAALQGADDGN